MTGGLHRSLSGLFHSTMQRRAGGSHRPHSETFHPQARCQKKDGQHVYGCSLSFSLARVATVSGKRESHIHPVRATETHIETTLYFKGNRTHHLLLTCPLPCRLSQGGALGLLAEAHSHTLHPDSAGMQARGAWQCGAGHGKQGGWWEGGGNVASRVQ